MLDQLRRWAAERSLEVKAAEEGQKKEKCLPTATEEVGSSSVGTVGAEQQKNKLSREELLRQLQSVEQAIARKK